MGKDLKELYKEDFPLWAEINHELLKEGRYQKVDWENLYTELEKLIQREVDEVAGYLSLLLEKLYIWENYRELIKEPKRHRIEIYHLRGRIELELEFSPSMKQKLERELYRAWNYARVRIRLWLEDLDKKSEAISFFYTFIDCPYDLTEALTGKIEDT